MALLRYGGGWISDLKLLAARRIRKILGWTATPHPWASGRWLRRATPVLLPVLDRLVWKLVRVRWQATGVPEELPLGNRTEWAEDQLNLYDPTVTKRILATWIAAPTVPGVSAYVVFDLVRRFELM